jgi:GAF domain-containing protein
MREREQSSGKCSYCGQDVSKASMTRHLSGCQRRQTAIALAECSSSARETLYHLRVQDASRSQFWLDLEMRGSARLTSLDNYLRAIWLECCGHLSMFTIGGWQGQQIAKARQADQVFRVGVQLTHLYDFGTTSYTLIRMVAQRVGKPTTRHAIALMARNLPPDERCIQCGQPAAWLCAECLIEQNVWGALCDEHAASHPHQDYGEPLPLVNSPRVGMCGYSGPAEPPY